MRLIDATRLVKLTLLERDKIPLNIVERYSFGTESPNRHGQAMRGGIRKVLRIIEQAPTIDAVPVVRCGDCKWYDSAFSACSKSGLCVTRDFYCADGEKE